MKIKCPECETLYDVSDDIAGSGIEVQCARCATIFPAAPIKNDEPAAESEDEGWGDEADEPAEFEAAVDDAAADPADLPASDDAWDKLMNEGAEEAQTAPPAEADVWDATLDAWSKEVEGTAGEEATPEPSPAADDPWDQTMDAAADATVEAPAADDPWDATLDAWSQEAEAPAGADAAADDFDAVITLDALELPEPEAKAEDQFAGSLSDEELAVFGSLIGGIGATPAAPEPTTSDDISWADEDDEPVMPPVVAVNEIELKEPDAESAPPPRPLFANDAQRRLWMGWAGLAAALLTLGSFGVMLREPISRAVPGMADLYTALGLPVNVRGLAFYGLSHQWQEEDGRLRLVVRGEIINITDRERTLPELVFAMHDGTGMEFFQWMERIEGKTLPPYGRTRFRAQIPAPPERVRRLHIRFAKE